MTHDRYVHREDAVTAFRLPRAAFGLLVAGLAMACGSVRAQSGEQIAKAGNAVGAPACVTCHGPTGQGQAAAGFPRLAGLNAAYFVQQLRSFSDGTRANPIMAPVAKLLSAADAQALATYYSALPVVDATGTAGAEASLVAAGQTLAKNGDWNNGVPACAQCHGAAGLGVGATFPRIAGQPAAYISNQLLVWQAGTRKNDPMGLMHGIALKLSASNISAVAAYYAGQSAAADNKRRAKP